jgi:hypothetical protein
MASFDVKRVTPLEWAGIGAGALAFIISFFPWYSFPSELSAFIGTITAWDMGFLAWFPILLLLAAGVLVLLPHLGTQVPNLPMIWMGLAGAAVLFLLLRWVTLPDYFGANGGIGFGFFIGLIVALASGAGAFMSYRASSSRSHA